MIILGLNYLEPSPLGHDTTVALLQDGFLRSAVSEERFSRIKHDGGYPSRAIQFCLNECGITFSDVDKVVVGFGLLENQIDESKKRKFGCYANSDVRFKKTLIESKDPVFYNHQYIHARTGYSLSGFRKAVIISLDGGGYDNGKPNSGGIFVANGEDIESIMTFPVNASLGFVYGILTQACGFRMQDGEGKTMSLAAFGERESEEKKSKAYHHVKEIFPSFRGLEYINGGIFDLVVRFIHNVQLIFCSDERINSINKFFKNELIAWAAQKRLEEIVIDLIINTVEKTGQKNVVLTGGIFMNMIMNMKIREKLGRNYQIFFNPVCGDVGNAIGSVFECYYQETGRNASFPKDSLYLGPQYTDDEVIASLKKMDFKYEKVDKIQTATELVNKGNIVGWFQGRSELGQRALGNRSIISLTNDIKYKDIVNEKVKKRESWRPFCPTIIEQKSSHYLEDPAYAPYMILGFKMNNSSEAPAVCHIDGTCRPQILKRDVNSDFYDVVKDVGGIILNTSFNLAGEPVVETPVDALNTLKNSNLDAIIINDFLVRKYR